MTQLIDVRERGRTLLDDEVVGGVPVEFWQSVGCKVTKGVNDSAWTLEAGDMVGVARLVTPRTDVAVRVRPKLDTADVFFLADYAYEQRHDPLRLLRHDDVELEALLRDPSACLLAWHAKAIHQFGSRWLRRDYRTIDRVLAAKIKGRPLINRYVSNHQAMGDAARIPCRWQERTQDTPNNRLLKAGLRFILSVSHLLPVPAARRVVMREAKAALPLFAQVSDIKVSARDLRTISSRGPMRHYRNILDATVALLQGRLMSDEFADVASTTSFMWDMPTLFQEALRGIIDSAAGLALLTSSVGSARVYDGAGRRLRSSKVDPDLVLSIDGRGVLLIDTKYKDALPSDHDPDDEVTVVAERQRVKVSRADIYQIVAYTHHEKWPDATGGLLYPTVLAKGDSLPAPLRVDGFGEPVWLLFVDIGPHAGANLGSFLETVRKFVAPLPVAA